MLRRATCILALATLVSGMGFAQPERGEGPGMNLSRARERMIDRLNLTEQQVTQIHRLRVEMQRKQIQSASKIRLARLDTREMVRAEKPDRPALEKKFKEISDLQLQARLDQLDHMLAIRTILTPEQLKIWKDRLDRPGPQMRRGRGLMKMGGELGSLHDGEGPEDLPGDEASLLLTPDL